MNGSLTTVVTKPSELPLQRLTTCNRTAPIAANRAVVTANDKAAARDKNILERISTIKANLQDATVEAQIGIHVRCF